MFFKKHSTLWNQSRDHFAMEMANKVSTEDAYQQIKDELKELKNVVNSLRKMDVDFESYSK
ncbi:MAG: hypothetical protein CM15mV26_1120 [uncultured marine virus]|nr:MAG: hypothetical protein CM15mV26_1120 [uncultured marine virus]